VPSLRHEATVESETMEELMDAAMTSHGEVAKEEPIPLILLVCRCFSRASVVSTLTSPHRFDSITTRP